jgi:hypothetical protein
MSLNPYNHLRHAVRYFLLRRLPTCRDVTPLMSQSMERPLTIRERVVLTLHLWICVWCVWYLEHLHKIRGVVTEESVEASVESSSEPGLPQDARDRLKSALRIARED